MSIFGLIKNWVAMSVETAQNILVPENIKIRKIMELPPYVMRELLPKSPVFMKDVIVLFDYQNKIVRLIVKSIKYKNNQGLRKRIAGYLYEELIEASSEIALWSGKPPVILPMPMSKKEKRERGFNQTEELCREINKLGGKQIETYFNILKKIRETERQTKLSREKREENVKNSMVVPTGSVGTVRNRVCIVLDDVYTTGASLSEARRALLSAGASRIIGLFITH